MAMQTRLPALAMLLLLVGQISFMAGDIFVSPTGSNSNPGTIDQPVQTIAKALSLAGPGDTVQIRQGAYREHDLAPPSGVAGLPVTIKAYNQEDVLLDGEFATYSYAAFGTTGGQYVTFEDLEVNGYRDRAFIFWDSSHITVRGCYIHHCGTLRTGSTGDGISMKGSHYLIEDNLVTSNCPDTIYGGSGIGIWMGSDSVIRNNTCLHNRGNGILVEDSHDVTVYGNVCRFNHGDFGTWFCGGIWVDGGWNITVHHNWFEGNEGAGMEISDIEPSDPYGYVFYNNVCTGNYYGMVIAGIGRLGEGENEIYCNTCVDNTDYGIVIVGAYQGHNPPSALCRLRLLNNIAYQGDAVPALYVYNNAGADNVLDYNLVYSASGQPVVYNDTSLSFAEYQQASGWETHGLSMDPLLRDPQAMDFHLAIGSPCFNRGQADYLPATDYDDVPRTGPPDLGAYEYQAYAADLNGDCRVSAHDLGILLFYWQQSGPADINGDGTVDNQDLVLLLGAWGRE